MNKIITLTAVSLLLVACGGGGGDSGAPTQYSGDVAGLKLPSSMSVVTASDDTAARGQIAARSAAKNLTDPDTDYVNDPVQTYVYDASMESLNTVNMILCLMEQTRASEMVNQGPYIALVNEDKCEQGEAQSSQASTGQSSSSQSTEYNSWTIESTRASESAPQHVKIWVPALADENEHPMDNQNILVELTATEGVSANKPFGSFSMTFKGVLDASLFGGPAGVEAEVMRGSLQTVDNQLSKPQFRFVNLGGDALASVAGTNFSMEESANVILDDAAGNSGVALTHRAESFSDGFHSHSEESTFAIAFDTDYLLRGKDENADNLADAQICKSRSDFDTQVWRYNLYHEFDGSFNGQAVSSGQRVELNSGFPFHYDSDNNGVEDSYGWVGYHGIWSEGNDLADGSVITQFDYASDSTIQHTVRVAPGKMIRRSANNELLASFQGDEFQYWGQHPTLNMHGQWLVVVDSNNDFQITASFEWGDQGPVISATVDHDDNPATAEVAVGAGIALSNYENLWLWNDALGGNVVYVHDDSVAAAQRSVTFYGEEFISASDAELFAGGNSVTLYCYDRCLKGGLTQTDVDNATYEHDLFHQYTNSAFVYTLSASDGKVVLTDNSNGGAVVSAVGLDLSALGNDWGINSGEMLTAQLPNAAEPWAVYEQSVTYRWETGDNEWNRMVSVVDAQGNVARFDRPLQFNYTHSTANDANSSSSHDGKKFFIEYGGAGELWGIPHEEDSETHRWHATITLADGVQLSNGENSFVVKAIEKEQSMKEDNAGCDTLSIDDLFTDPELALPSSSDIGTVSITLAGKPVVSVAPAVIEGEIQN